MFLEVVGEVWSFAVLHDGAKGGRVDVHSVVQLDNIGVAE